MPEKCITGPMMLGIWKSPPRRLSARHAAPHRRLRSLYQSYLSLHLNRDKTTARHGDELPLLRKNWTWFLERLLILRAYRALTPLRLIPNHLLLI